MYSSSSLALDTTFATRSCVSICFTVLWILNATVNFCSLALFSKLPRVFINCYSRSLIAALQKEPWAQHHWDKGRGTLFCSRPAGWQLEFLIYILFGGSNNVFASPSPIPLQPSITLKISLLYKPQLILVNCSWPSQPCTSSSESWTRKNYTSFLTC